MRYAHQVCRKTKAETFILKSLLLSDNEQYYIRTILDISAYIRGLTSKPKQDFNRLFGYKYDGVTQTPISGVSLEGKSRTGQNKEINEFHLFYFFTGVDLLDRLLSFDPRERPTAGQALGKLSQ